MYVSNTARYLGDSTVAAPVQRDRQGSPQRCADLWRAARCYKPQLTFAEFQRRFPACVNTLQCGDNRLPSGSVLAIDCAAPAPRALGNAYVPPTVDAYGTIPACQDPPTGLLIDCWNAAVAKGLNGLGQDQATLTRLSTAYQRLTRPDRLAGLGSTFTPKPVYLPRPIPIKAKQIFLPRPPKPMSGWVPKPGGGMMWVHNPRPLGDALPDDINDDFAPGPGMPGSSPSWSGGSGVMVPTATGGSAPAPAWVVPTDIPPPVSTVFQPSPIPPVLQNLQPTLPTVSAQTLLAAAALPNAPAVVKQAAAQLSSSGSATSWFTQSMISGIPNYLLVGGGLFLVVLLASAGGRRR